MFYKYIFTKQCAVVVVGVLTIFGMISQIPDRHRKIPLQEIKQFAFAKNHKCGSSTVENVIFRFALKKQLNLVMPLLGNYLSKIQLFNHSHLKEVEWENVPFDIFSLHSRWNRQEVMAVLKQEVPTFAIVRNPVDAFVSFFHYWDKIKEFYGVSDIHDLVYKIKSSNQSQTVLNKRWRGSFGRNQIAWDMGLSPGDFDNKTAMQKEIERLDSEFDLVMISDRMDESLILLKELLHWPLENVVHLDLNRRKPEASPLLTANERKVLTDWLSADVQIYEYFSRRFDERIAKLNEKNFFIFRPNFVEKETRMLEEANKKLYDLCVISEVGNEKLKGKFKETSNRILGYVINEEQEGCDLYAMSEPAYLEIFRKRLLEIS